MIKIVSMLLIILLISGCIDTGCTARCLGDIPVRNTYKATVELCIGEDNTNYSKPFDCGIFAINKAREFCNVLCDGE